MWTSMGAQFIKHKNWDDLATSDWKHLFSMQSNFKKFEEIWRFILLIRSLFRRWARRQNLNAVVWGSPGFYSLDTNWSMSMAPNFEVLKWSLLHRSYTEQSLINLLSTINLSGASSPSTYLLMMNKLKVQDANMQN